MSSPGADGGIDAENDPAIGQLTSEQSSLLVNTVLSENKVVVFQFKHKVVARVGEANARKQLLALYKANSRRISEVNKENILKRKPSTYVLVTNVEVNSIFRQTFNEQCHSENPSIENYQVVGLDELENWVTSERNLRSAYFPTIFGRPRFNLKLKLVEGLTYSIDNPQNLSNGKESICRQKEEILCLSVMNVGEETSYLSSIKFKALIKGEVLYLMKSPLPKGYDPLSNPPVNEPIQPGKCLDFRFSMEMFRQEFKLEKECFLSEVIVFDQIDNQYSLEITDTLRGKIFNSYINKS